jgi:hypothetical protein
MPVKYVFYSLALVITGFLSCREEYLPPVLTSGNNFLVVEGILNGGTDSTIIRLSRTRNLSDTTFDIPELDAGVLVEARTGGNYALSSIGNGLYGAILPIQNNETYRLRISTRSGGLYESEYIAVKNTPAIDSITWKQDVDLTIFLNTRDIQNRTRYYRWDYTETWEYRSYYDTNLGFDYFSNTIFFRDSTQQTHKCWSTARSNQVLLGTTDNLSQDIVKDYPITKILNGDFKVDTRYSILVKQYALSKQEFQYWQLLKKNAKELGSIFGTQPAELISNIKCISNPAEPVIGYIGASSVSEKRIFISNNQLQNWDSRGTQDILCTPVVAPRDSISDYLQRDNSLSPAYFITGGGLALAKRTCVDCRIRGGNTQKPSFW